MQVHLIRTLLDGLIAELEGNDDCKSKGSMAMSASKSQYAGPKGEYSRERNLFSPDKRKKRHLRLSEVNENAAQAQDGPQNLSQQIGILGGDSEGPASFS